MNYVADSTWPVGNDGLHYNDSINRPPNLSVSQQMADAIHYASDHLPLIAKFVFHSIASVNEQDGENGSLRVYPNPVSGVCTLRLPTGSGYTVQVMDMTGRLVYSEGGLEGTVGIDVSELVGGIYKVIVQNAHTGEYSLLLKE